MVNEGVPSKGDQVPQGEQVPLVNQENEVPLVPWTCIMSRLDEIL